MRATIGLILILFVFYLFPKEDLELRLVDSLLQNTTDKYWTYDRTSSREVISIASTGMGFVAFARSATRGAIRPETASEWIKTGFDNMLAVNRENHGWLYHWVNPDGIAIFNKEVSSIDSTLFYMCAERSARELGNTVLLDHILSAKSKVDVKFMMDGQYFRHGFIWKNGRPAWLNNNWEEYSEGILIYKYFNIPYVPTKVQYNLPLFVYYFPVLLHDSVEGRNYLSEAIEYQKRTYGTWGFTSTDTPAGYRFLPLNVISPIGIFCCRSFYNGTDKRLEELEVDVLTPAISLDGSWRSNDRILLDDGFALISIGRYK